MGLYIYILRVRKTKKIKEGTLFNSSDLYREDILFESMDKENLDLIKELIPYGIRVKVKQEYVNKEGVLKYLGICSCRYAYIDMGNKITACDDDYKEYTIPPEEAGKYIYTQDDDYLACEVDRVAYWRRNYEVTDFFYDNIEAKIENNGYYRLNTKILQKFNKTAAQLDSEPLPVEKPTKRVALFYTLSY